MSGMNGWVCGAICGASAMYFFDPQQGRRRRALFRDQVDRAVHRVPQALDVAWRDLSNRTYGTAAAARSMFAEHDNSDETICNRVRSTLGRCCSHPRAIGVEVSNGCVRLRGPILASDVQNVVQTVKWLRGVQAVQNELDVHDAPGDIAALQGGSRMAPEACSMLEGNWSPATRLLAGGLGTALLMNSMLQKTATSTVLGALGLALVGRCCVPNQSMRQFSEQPQGRMRSEDHSSTRHRGSAAPQPARPAMAASDSIIPESMNPARQDTWPPSSADPNRPATTVDPPPPVI
jgi:hypothetical protein